VKSEKFRNFYKTVPLKLFVLLAAIVLIAFFSNDFGLVDIQKTAVILAVGLDKEDENYTVTAQIAVPKGSDRTTGGTSSVEITGEGRTVADGFGQIYAKTGWVPKLVFCNLIVVGEETAKKDVFCCLDYFLRNEYMSDNCLLAVCEGKASELLSSTSAIDDTSSLAVEKLFSDASEKSGKVMKNSLKDFSIAYYGPSHSSYMPYVRAIEQSASSGESTGGNTGGNGGGGSSGGQQTQEKVFSAQETALFRGGVMVALLNAQETFAFSLLESKIVAGTFTVQKEGKSTSMTVIEDKGSVELNMEGAPKATLSVNVRLRLYNRCSASPVEDISASTPTVYDLENANAYLNDCLALLVQKCVESDCDVLLLKRSLYRSSLKKYREWEQTLLQAVTPELKVTARGIT